ncbi:class I SAM-dependent methyltransferase [Rossellomorea vietnamensis]|uniref:class I SAM-dependent methyltransferase n=1 Tax=Rossellomorea vietnamensis TaxID=218284 RepID=UPI00077C8DDE|nr:class I SAM-dependent methyltransferase [Rossellomorea vietnamensis]
MEVNFGNVTSRYAASCDDIPHQFFDTLKVRGIVWEGRKVAEIGAGTGALTRKLHKRGAEVIGVEPSIELRKTAKALESRQYLEIPYLTGTAESTNLPDHYYDITMSHRSWHLFDRPKAIHEMKRILKEKGTFIVSDSSFLPNQEFVKDTMTFLHEYIGETPEGKADPGNQVNGFPVEWLLEWQQADFTIKDFYTFYYMVDFTIQSWCERVGSLSLLSHLKDTEIEGLLQSLHTFLSRRHDSLHEFTLQHQFTVCLMKK